MTKKLPFLAIVLVIAICFSFMSIPVYADYIILPDGGTSTNSGFDELYGRTSGGYDGYANITCMSTCTNAIPGDESGESQFDMTTAKIWSDVPQLSTTSTSTITAIIYYNNGTSEVPRQSSANITYITPQTGKSVIVSALNAYANYGVGNYTIVYSTRGRFSAGTRVRFS